MADVELFRLVCNGCGKFAEAPLPEVIAPYVLRLMTEGKHDQAMALAREQIDMPEGWISRPGPVRRNTLNLNFRTGVGRTTSTHVAEGLLDFCGDCARRR